MLIYKEVSILRSGLEEGEYRECCYNCKRCKMLKGGQGMCNVTNRTIEHVNNCWCPQWKDAGLVQCEICGKFLRNLGIHLVMTHKTTVDKYKEKYGINRTTPLSSKTTSQLLSETASTEQRISVLLANRFTPGTKGMTWNLRDEAIMNMSAYQSNRPQETNEKISKSKRGRPTGPGRPLTQEHKKKIAASLRTRLAKSVKRTIERDSQGRIKHVKDEYRK